MGMLAGRRDELGRARTQVTGRLHRLLLELHIMAVVLRNQARGRACYDARRAGGMPSMMALRALKRRLSNVVFSCMLADQKRREASPGGQPGTPADSSVTGHDRANRPFGQATFRTRHSTASTLDPSNP
jgi:hypothetical protein